MSHARENVGPDLNAARSPRVVLLGGPNGAGKSTMAAQILRGSLGVTEFLNADVIARGLSGFQPETASIAAGRAMLSRMKHLAEQRIDFAFETTLASRSFVPWLKELLSVGYEFHMVFLCLRSQEAAIARVADRVRCGGHSISQEVVRRRFQAGVRNFFALYQPLAMSWQVVDNSYGIPRMVAAGSRRREHVVIDDDLWAQLMRMVNNDDAQ